MNSKQKIGHVGERFVAEKLASAGWTVLARNYRFKGCELDIVVTKGQSLAIVEVKTRQHWSDEDANDLIPHRKLLALKRGLDHFTYHAKSQFSHLRLDLALVCTRPKLHIRSYQVDAYPLEELV